MSAAHACVCGDSTTAQAFDDALGGRLANALITDPPYCLLTRRRKNGTARDPKDRKIERGPLQRFDDVRAYRTFTEAWFSHAVKRLAPDAPVVIWTNLLGKAPIVATVAAHGYPYLRGEFVWAKRTREGNSGEELLRLYEVALVFSTKAPAPARDDEPAIPWAAVGGYDDDGEAVRWGSHPNHKPFSVIEPLVRTWSRPGEVVLDCFAGSGSIPHAAARLGRVAVGIEREPEWAQRVSKRLATR